ncbi:MAG: hypothetical protein M3Q30_00660 [Actinomycetota bacterium]|nr:hypothetical protein [Actinomycetota bacterium]
MADDAPSFQAVYEHDPADGSWLVRVDGLDPDAHAGAAYALTSSEAITVSEAAEVIAGVTGKPVKHNDIDRDVWIQGSVAAGVPAEYGEMLRMLTETIASGMGSRPNDNVQKVTGAPPIKFADFARRTAQAWT